MSAAKTETETVKRYRVTVPYATVRVANTMLMPVAKSPWLVVGLTQGALVPSDAHSEDVARLARRGSIEELI